MGNNPNAKQFKFMADDQHTLWIWNVGQGDFLDYDGLPSHMEILEEIGYDESLISINSG